MAVQADGKILVAEAGRSCCGIRPVELGRLAADGSSDPTFVTLEVVGASSGWGSTFNVIVVEGNGRTLFEGSADSAPPDNGGPQKGLTRLNADGSIDESFHPMMDKLIDGDGGSRAAVVVQPDGKIVIAGLFNQVNGVDRPGLARLNPDGSTDPSFVPENNDESYHNIHPLAYGLGPRAGNLPGVLQETYTLSVPPPEWNQRLHVRIAVEAGGQFLPRRAHRSPWAEIGELRYDPARERLPWVTATGPLGRRE